jgi:hypothetical protein
MTSRSSYRAVCRLCQTVLVTCTPHGAFVDYDVAVKAMDAHLKNSCDQSGDLLNRRGREIVAETSIEVIEGVA